eukprot:jgi/Mesen1/3683/ME000202S02772
MSTTRRTSPSSSTSFHDHLPSRIRDSVLDRKWLLPLLATVLVSLVLLAVAITGTGQSGGQNKIFSSLWSRQSKSATDCLSEEPAPPPPPDGPPLPPVIAYSITGSVGDTQRVKRLLQALYHPRNEYLIHLDMEAPPRERVELARYVRLDPTFAEVGNVHMVAKANLVTYRGSTMTSTYLHCIAILLRERKDWDWYINLSASDYPLMPQDDILHVFSYLPRDLNFIEHNNHLGWKEDGRARPIMMDPAIYSTKKQDLFFATQRRSLPTAFKLYEGSAWVMLSRPFTEYVIWGYDNLPRLALMYFTNYVSSPEGYIHTVVCNSKEFKNTTVNSDLHYIKWDYPPKQHPQVLEMLHFPEMAVAGEPFARKFPREAEVLDKVDSDLLHRAPSHFTPGGWCLGSDEGGKDPCWVRGDPTVLKPGPGAERLQKLLLKLLEPGYFRRKQCPP